MDKRLTVISAAVSLDDGIAHYLARLQRRGRAANTLRAYGTDLRQFAAHVLARCEATLVALQSQRIVSGWLDSLSAAGVSQRSAARKLAVLRGFFRYAKAEGWLGHDPTAGELVRFRARRVTAPEMNALLGMVAAIPADTPAGVRDRAMLRLALDAALRISEVATLDLPGLGAQASVDLERGLVHVIGKGGDTQTVAVNARTVQMLRDWLAVRDRLAAPGETALFVSSRGSRLSRQSLHVLLKSRAQAAGLDAMTWHLMRHRRVGQIYEALGAKVAQEHARHSSAATTEAVYGAHHSSVTRALIRERADLDGARAAA